MLLTLYYWADLPLRRHMAGRLAAAGRSPLAVLFYHRIADDRANPWTASNRMFARQMFWLKRHFELVSLDEVQRRVAAGENRRPAVSVTFDDGYADNCQAALPLLVAERIPCTYFVATRFVLEGQPFPHDVRLGKPPAPNTPRQIRELADAGIEIGAHTRTHADLGAVSDPGRLRDELSVARHELQEITGRAVRFFAFPFGQHRNLSPLAFLMARQLGYQAVCSAYGGYNFPGDDPFHVQRIHVDDDMIRLKNWVTLDRRKLRTVQRYEYADSTPGAGLPNATDLPSAIEECHEALTLPGAAR